MIIKSILDTDLYKFTTSYAYMKLFPQARGTFEFIDRDNTEYPEDFIERLYLELGSLGMLHLTKDEQEYMNNSCRFIPPVYWEWLSSFKFNSGKIQASLDENGHLHIKVTVTNDTGFKPANIVMKLTSCQMNSNQPIFGCVKLSDDAGKHTGKIEDVQRCLTDLGYAYRVP